MSAIQSIYVALFGRPADPGGLAYWTEVTKDGADLSVMLDTLPSLPEYQARFAGMTNSEIVNSIYLALFGRDAEPEGLAYFTQLLTSGEKNLGNIAVTIMQSAQGTDKDEIDAKVEAANLFTAALDTPEEIEAYSGDDAIAVGKAYLDGVTKDKPATQESADGAVKELLPDEGQEPNQPGPGTDPVTPTPDPVDPNETRVISADDLVGADPASWTAGNGVDTLIVDFTDSSVLLHELNLSGIQNVETLVIRRGDVTVPKVGAFTIDGLPASIRTLVLEGDFKLGGSVTIDHPTLTTFVVVGDVVGTGSGPNYGNLNFKSGDDALEHLTIVTNGTVDGIRISGVENLTFNSTENVGDNAAVRLDGIKALSLNGTEFSVNLLDGALEGLSGNAAKATLTNAAGVNAEDFAGDLKIIGTNGDNTLITGAGNDIIWGDIPTSGAVQADKYGDDTIDAGAGSNIVVLGTTNQNILAGGADTVIIDGSKAGTTAVFNFNFGPVGDERSVGGTLDDVFDVIDFRNVSLADIRVSIGNSNAAYLDVVADATGSEAVTSGNLITIDGTNVYAGPATGSEFELVITAGAHTLVFSNALSVFEKLALVEGLDADHSAISLVTALLADWGSKTNNEKIAARADAEPILHDALADLLNTNVGTLTSSLVDVTDKAGDLLTNLIGQGNFNFTDAVI